MCVEKHPVALSLELQHLPRSQAFMHFFKPSVWAIDSSEQSIERSASGMGGPFVVLVELLLFADCSSDSVNLFSSTVVAFVILLAVAFVVTIMFSEGTVSFEVLLASSPCKIKHGAYSVHICSLPA